MNYAFIDIGNTSIYAKIYPNNTDPYTVYINRTEKALRLLVNHLNLDRILISSVVPSVDAMIQSFGAPNVHFITHADFDSLDILIDPIESVGIDRLVNVLAVVSEYKKNALVIDAGTVVTCCHINQKGAYQGGIILPGFHMVRNALHQYAEKLPLISFPGSLPHLIGQSTQGAIESGMFYGSMHMINGIQQQIKQQYPHLTVILTGGVPKELLSHIQYDVYDKELPFKGMQLMYNQLFDIAG